MITVHGIVNDLKLVPVGFVDNSEYLTCRSTLFNFWGFGVLGVGASGYCLYFLLDSIY